MIATFRRASDIVPEGLDPTNPAQLEPLYKELIDRELHCAKCVETLILDRSELDAAVNEAGTNLFVRMTCHTEDAQAKNGYLAFVEQVEPKVKEWSFALDRKIAGAPQTKDLDPARYTVLLRDLRTAVEIFRPENIPLETELTKKAQEYKQIQGATTVLFRGEERTMPQMGVFAEETDRRTREDAWRASNDRRLKDAEPLSALYDQMIALRHQVALNAGFANYRDYAFKARRRFDYTPADCAKFADGVERVVVPALRRLNRERASLLGVGTLRPWDLAVDVRGRPPLKPFAGADDLVAKTKRVFRRMDPSTGGLADMFESLLGGGCLDLDSRKGKAPGGYQANRDRQRVPFIFMNAAGLQRDVETMVHEAGHAFHSILTRNENVLMYRSEMPLEFCEVASMSMELTTHKFLDEFYTPSDAARAVRVHLEQLATLLPWIATIDQFQHWVYTNPTHTRDQRREAWLSLMNRFGAEADWSGLEEHRALWWQRQGHLYGSAFYYIEYGIAQLGALQLWSKYRRDPEAALNAYKQALSLGASRPLPDLFAAAGLTFDFGAGMIERVWTDVESELARLPA